MKIATLATIGFAVGFATAIAPAHSSKSCIARPHLQNVGGTDLDTEYFLTGPDLMPVQYGAGIPKARERKQCPRNPET